MTADEPKDKPDAELEDALGEEDEADAAEGEAIIPGLPHRLVPRQKRFAERYVIHFNGTQAAKEAGYTGSRKTLGVRACTLLKLAKVKSYVAHLMAPDVDKIDAAYIKRQILIESLVAKHSRDRLKAWELLGRSIGVFVDVHEHSISGRSSESLIHGLLKTQPELARLIAPYLGVELPPEKAGGSSAPTTPPAKA